MKFRDMADVKEDDRIKAIVNTIKQGLTVGVAVDDEPEKIARYKRKVAEACPGAIIEFEGKGPTPGAYIIKYRLGN